MSGCSGPDELSAEHRQRIGRIGLAAMPRPAKETIYADQSTGVLMAAGGFGMVGGLLGAANMAAGESRFSPVTEPHRQTVAGLLGTKLNEALAKAGKRAAGQSDATVRVEHLRFGVEHIGDQQFVARVHGKFLLVLPDGEPAFEGFLSAASKQGFRRLDAQANAAIYRAALAEAIEAVANQFVWQLFPESASNWSRRALD